ncbi:hypothetical protein [Sphingomonas sp.]|uniref:hypothetical protein n=1 Tax=Sphingomonas sp. TaxID=28214 RepID=UPI0025E89C48|nr:hypothetical protein [Sphingomonas sp.]
MKYQHDSFTADPAPDASGSLAMKTALREFRNIMRQSPAAHPMRAEMLGVLADARKSIDRINAKEA